MFVVKFITFVAIICMIGVTVMAKPHPDEADVSLACPKMCTKEYAPVCATLSDGSSLEFGNECMSRVERCSRNLDIQTLDYGKCA